MVSRQSQEPDNPSGPAELPTFVAANGLRLTTEDGRIFLDFASGFESARVEAVQEAITEHLRAAHFHGDAETRFLDDLRTILPAGLSHVHPTRDGSEATEVALSACMRYTGATTFLAFKGGCHGSTLGALAVSHARRGQELLELSAPSAEFIDYPLADERSASSVAAAVRAITERPPDSPPLAGVIVEPVQSRAGIKVPPQTFLPTLARAAHSYGTPLIIDERFTAFGRTGRAFACELSGVSPDLLLMGNGMGSGLPGGAVAGREDILSPLPPTPHRLHPMTATACTSALRYAMDNDLWSHAQTIESWFESCRGKLETHVLVRRFHGVGAMYGIEVSTPAGVSSRNLASEVRAATLDHGLLMWECGTNAVVIGLIPPLMVTKKDIDDACDMIVSSLDDIAAPHHV